MKKELIWISLLVVACSALMLPASGQKGLKRPKGKTEGESLFEQYCSGCHLGGGNIAKDNHPIIGSKQLANLPIFKTYLSNPPGHMPYYQNLVSSDKKLKSIYDYCKSLKASPAPREAFLPDELAGK